MSPRREALVVKRAALLARSAAVRSEFASAARSLETPLAWGDQALQGLDWLRRNPAWPTAAAGLLIVLRPGRAWRLARRALATWRIWRRARPYAALLAQGWQRGMSRR